MIILGYFSIKTIPRLREEVLPDPERLDCAYQLLVYFRLKPNKKSRKIVNPGRVVETSCKT